jgi:nucleoside-diphosphate-sugar epimerase
VLDLLHAIAEVFGYELEREFLPARAGDIRDSHADISLARSLLKYAPVTGFPEGLKETSAWLRDPH